MMTYNKHSRKKTIKVVATSLVALLVLMLALPPSDSAYVKFSANLKSSLGKDVGMFSPVSLKGVEGSYVFIPGAVDSLIAFNNSASLNSLIFYRDNVLNYSAQSITVKDKLNVLLTSVPLGSPVSLNFTKSSTAEGTFFKIPAISKDYFLVAISGASVKGMASILPSNSVSTQTISQYGNLTPMLVVSKVEPISPIIKSRAFIALGDVINGSMAFINSVTSAEKLNAKNILNTTLNNAISSLSTNNEIPDGLKNTIGAVYAHLYTLIDSNISDAEGKYAILLTGVQTELARNLLQSTVIGAGTVNGASSSLSTTVNGSGSGSSPAGSSTVVKSGASGQIAASPSGPAANMATSAQATPMPSVALPQGFAYKDVNLSLPSSAGVSTTSVSAPCDPFNGYKTHYLATQECSGGNVLRIPLGLFSLVYNSVKTDDKIFGLVGWKFSFHEYIDLAKLMYVTASDQKIVLTKVGVTLKPSSFTWGDYLFTISGADILRDDTKGGLRYIYRKASPSDPIYRLTVIQKISDGSKVFALTFNATGDPFYADFFDDKGSVKKVGIYRPKEMRIDYPDGTYPDVSIQFNGQSIYSATYDKTQIDFRIAKAPNGREFPISQSWYYTDINPDNNSRSHTFFTYDQLGHILRSESLNYGLKDKEIRIATDISYPNYGGYHRVVKESPISKSHNWYSKIGSYVLKAASTGPFGNDSYKYSGAPHYSFWKQWDASRNAWTAEVTKLTETEKEVKTPSNIINTTKNSNTYTKSIKDLSGVELVKTSYTDKGDGQYSKTQTAGSIEKTDTRDKVASGSNAISSTSVTKVDGKIASNVSTIVSDTLNQSTDLLNGSSYKKSIVGDSYTEEISAPNDLPYKNEVTNVVNSGGSTSEWKTSLGGSLVGKGSSRVTKYVDGANTDSVSYVPEAGTKYWKKYTDKYTYSSKTTEKSEALVPAVK